MAVAVKNTPEVTSTSLLDRMAIASLAGSAYVLGTLGIVCYLLPSLWQSLGWEDNASWLVRILIQIAAATGLLVFGTRLLGPKASHGVRAGIFVGLLSVLLILLLARWGSLWIEHWSYDRALFGPSTGAILTAILGLGLLVLGVRLFLSPWAERFLVQLEEQGWFTARPYKGLQGLRVRRGTIFGILLLVGAGIWTMLAHGTLRKGATDWHLNVPFTGHVVVESTGDVSADVFAKYVSMVPDWETHLNEHTLVVNRFILQEINQNVDPKRYVKIIQPGESKFDTNQIVPRDEYNTEIQKLKKEGETEPQVAAPQAATGPLAYRTLTLLPSMQFTLPLIMLVAGVWLAWRIVNVPAFADFLIATEAEMNKVSWTTQRRLVQDTVVVLVTVVLMAFYLFSMDVVWKSVLSWEYIGVLKISPDNKRGATQPPEDRPW